MRSIGLSENTYTKLLTVKHNLEKEQDRVISYDEVINTIIGEINNEI